jgi:hypothetical protein
MVKGKKRKKFYKEGVVKISKCQNPIQYRSGWEHDFSLLLEQDPNVIQVEYETLRIPYISNRRTQKIRTYIPDFLITYADGSRKVIEIKRGDRVESKIVLLKKFAAENYLAKCNPPIQYSIWTKKQMDEYRKGLNANTTPVIEESELLTESKPSANKPKTVRKKIKKAKAKLPLDDSQRLLLQTYKKCTTPKTKK